MRGNDRISLVLARCLVSGGEKQLATDEMFAASLALGVASHEISTLAEPVVVHSASKEVIRQHLMVNTGPQFQYIHVPCFCCLLSVSRFQMVERVRSSKSLIFRPCSP